MRSLRHLFVIALAFALSSATGQPADVSESFISSDGYLEVDSLALEEMIEEALPPSDSVFLAAGRLSPLAKAVYALEALDGTLERARYSLSAAVAPGSGEVLIQLDRYNLGPVIRQELVDSIGAEHVAPDEEFGVGPHVSLRLVTARVMGHEAMIVGASRKVIDEAEAALLECLLGRCLELSSATGSAGFLEDLQEQRVALDVDYDVERGGLPSPAALFDMLAEATGLMLYDNEALFGFQGERLEVAVAVLDTNLAQAGGSDGVVRVGPLLDDAVAALWQRLVALPGWSAGEPLYGASAVECRRGEPVGGLCP